jgi:hypothetical protein
MGPLEIHLNGAATGEGFVIVSDPAQPLPATLSLRTADGSAGKVECRPAPGSVATLSISPATVHVSGTPVAVQVLAITPSEGQNDTTVEVVQGHDVLSRFDLSAIAAPRVRFKGRFQIRLATNADAFDEEWGTGASGFRMYAIQGPNADDPNQPSDEPPLDRIIRFHDGVALRPCCAPIGVTVTQIEADVGGSTLRFAVGDPLIGLPVRLGPTCTIEERDQAFAVEGRAPISDFRLEIGSVFAGASEPASPLGQPVSNAPRANGIVNLAAPNPPWVPADFGYEEETWPEHATAVVARKQAQLEADTPADPKAERIRARRLQEHQTAAASIAFPMRFMQRYSGALDRELSFAPNSAGGLAYLATLTAVHVAADLLDFDTDCQCGSVTGTLGAAADLLTVPTESLMPPGEGRNVPKEAID